MEDVRILRRLGILPHSPEALALSGEHPHKRARKHKAAAETEDHDMEKPTAETHAKHAHGKKGKHE